MVKKKKWSIPKFTSEAEMPDGMIDQTYIKLLSREALKREASTR
jgi:hypothetical protein